MEFLISRNGILDIKKYSINSKTAPQNTFLDIKNSIFWYPDSVLFLNFKKSHSWYQDMHFLYQEFDFLISKIRTLDIKILIFWYQELDYLISRIRILDIKKSFLDIKKSNSRYQEILIISWYQENEFSISQNRILDIKNSISWYQEIEFLISKNQYLDIKNIS